jgi:hypothetical protein
MTFNTTSDLIRFIQETHTMFGERETNGGEGFIYGIDHTSEYIGKLEEYIKNEPAAIGGNFHARTNEDHGGIDTIITINKNKDGAWEYVERPIR